MLIAPDQYQERDNQVATPDKSPRRGPRMAANLVCLDQRSVKIKGRMPGHAMMGRKYVDQLFVAPAYSSMMAKPAIKKP